jgi:lipoate-protein ligase A
MIGVQIMKLILSSSSSAAFNLATEEYLFKSYSDDIFYLYINAPSIIVGRKQNTLAEVNIDYVTQHNIPVIRRLSGGGAVFHDLGNLNFCFIMRGVSKIENDFSKYTQPIIDLLKKLNVNATLEGRNDLTIDGKKFSGNAKFFSQNTLLQHGTILFASALSNLAQALKVDPAKFSDKAVKSVQSRVTNIYEHLSIKITIEEFTKKLIDYICSIYEDVESYTLSESDNKAIAELVGEKYGTFAWNFGSSPIYNFTKSIRTVGGTVQLSMMVKEGAIAMLNFYGDFFALRDIDEYEATFANLRHDLADIKIFLTKNPPEKYFINVTNDEIFSLFS